MEVQIFGTRKSADTRHALRFFSERQWKVHFVDLAERAMSPGELRRFITRLGIESLIDRESPRFRDLGLAAAPPGAGRWEERLHAEPLLLRQPLIRWKEQVSAGRAEAVWKGWLDATTRSG